MKGTRSRMHRALSLSHVTSHLSGNLDANPGPPTVPYRPPPQGPGAVPGHNSSLVPASAPVPRPRPPLYSILDTTEGGSCLFLKPQGLHLPLGPRALGQPLLVLSALSTGPPVLPAPTLLRVPSDTLCPLSVSASFPCSVFLVAANPSARGRRFCFFIH